MEVVRAVVSDVDWAAEWEVGEERVEDSAAEGEVSGLVDGRMEEASVEAECSPEWAAEEGDAKEGGRVEEEYGTDGVLERGDAEALR